MKYLKKYEARRATEEPFIQSSKRGSSNAVKKFIKQGVDINMRSNTGDNRTALMWASLDSFLMVVDILIKSDADVNLVDKDGRNALMMSSTKSIIKKLLDAGTNVNTQEYIHGDTVIMEFLTYYKGKKLIEMLELFLEYDLDLDLVNKKWIKSL